MAFGQYEDESTALFFTDHPDESFSGWMAELCPKDPYYGSKPDWKPLLAQTFEQLNVYDEMILYYLLFTINSTLSINSHNTYSEMNDLMKKYSFLQLSHLHEITCLDDEQKEKLRDFFFFFYLYAHPVNEETLHACSFHTQHLIHTRTSIPLEDYFATYYDFYTTHRDNYVEQIVISAEEIQACKTLTLELLHAVEGRSPKLLLPSVKGLEPVIQLINDVDGMLKLYKDDPVAFCQIIRDLLTDVMRDVAFETNAGANTNTDNTANANTETIRVVAEGTSDNSRSYREYCLTVLLQNYASYILFFDFNDIRVFINAFQDTPKECRFIISKMFTDTIFLQKMIRQQKIDLNKYPEVTQFFNEEAKQGYL
ncbi:hypothetical protein M3629_16320 [Paenibacillus polysaccharolyticus]|uniref:hypothetical protein n=1 Tax=Paenibacillus polysaccharolyticus TaxID=582692 RepID=UPI00203CDF89|nr:hypothetical protein [Paenibacillus polysaccharolyticus]MCM3134360.1 hypothetical protein [Paenibacillus polysaccharolyticus]